MTSREEILSFSELNRMSWVIYDLIPFDAYQIALNISTATISYLRRIIQFLSDGFIGSETHIKYSLAGHLRYLRSTLCIIYCQCTMFLFQNTTFQKCKSLVQLNSSTMIPIQFKLFYFWGNKSDFQSGQNISIKFKYNLPYQFNFCHLRVSTIALRIFEKTV